MEGGVLENIVAKNNGGAGKIAIPKIIVFKNIFIFKSYFRDILVFVIVPSPKIKKYSIVVSV